VPTIQGLLRGFLIWVLRMLMTQTCFVSVQRIPRLQEGLPIWVPRILITRSSRRSVTRHSLAVYHSSGPVSRSKYTNTHDQTKALVALCVPKRFYQSWESAFDDCRDADRALDALQFSECSLLPSGKFGITPLCWLEHAFRTSIGSNHVKATKLCMGESPTQTSSLFDIGE
jgi:hypothetical protein